MVPWVVDFRTVPLDLSNTPDDALRGRAFGRMALLLLKHARDGDLWERLPTWSATITAVQQESGLRALETVMRYVIEVEKGPPSPEVRERLVARFGRGTVETIMGWGHQLREEGRVEEARAMLARLVATRFGSLPRAVAEAIEHAGRAQLEAWTDRLFTAERPEDVVAVDS